jgi:hypothetical protein
MTVNKADKKWNIGWNRRIAAILCVLHCRWQGIRAA